MSFYDNKNYTPEQRAMYKQAAIIQNSAHHQRLKQIEAEAFAEREKQQAETERLAAWHLEDSRRQRAAEEEAKRKEAAANFEADLRRRFFEGNPFAKESDFQTMLPEIRKRAMLENIDTADKAEEMTRASGNYKLM